MDKSLLFIPDISGFTKFVQTTEVEHSQHVISELLEVLISANTLQLQLAEVEGDALFFYNEGVIPSQEKLLAQVETMFTAFYSHLSLLEKHRICPCNACATAPQLQLKIIVHCGELQFLTVGGNRKPFGEAVIEVHRLLKNSVNSDNYTLISERLCKHIGLIESYSSKLFSFTRGEDRYDGKQLSYIYSEIDKENLELTAFTKPYTVEFCEPPALSFHKKFDVDAPYLLELISNYRYRHKWVDGVDSFEFNENEVTRLGTKHICVIDGKLLDFVTVSKASKPHELLYGEMTRSAPLIDRLYQFYTIEAISSSTCNLRVEVYWETSSYFKKVIAKLFISKALQKNINKALRSLEELTKEESAILSNAT